MSVTSEDDVELRDSVIQALEANGTLSKLRAQLRANVFLAVEQQRKLQAKSALFNANATSYFKSPEGVFYGSLVREFLSFNGLTATCSVFAAESGLKDDHFLSKEDLIVNLKMDSLTSAAILVDLVKYSQPAGTSNVALPKPSPPVVPSLSLALSDDTQSPRNDTDAVSNFKDKNAAGAATFSSQTSHPLPTAAYKTSDSSDDDFFSVPKTSSAVHSGKLPNSIDSNIGVSKPVLNDTHSSMASTKTDSGDKVGIDALSTLMRNNKETSLPSSTPHFLSDLPQLPTPAKLAPLPPLSLSRPSIPVTNQTGKKLDNISKILDSIENDVDSEKINSESSASSERTPRVSNDEDLLEVFSSTKKTPAASKLPLPSFNSSQAVRKTSSSSSDEVENAISKRHGDAVAAAGAKLATAISPAAGDSSASEAIAEEIEVVSDFEQNLSF